MLDERLLLFWPLLHLLSLVTVHSWICMFLPIKSPHFPQYHCIHGIHDCFDHLLFIAYICLAVALKFDEKPVPLPEIYPLKVWANYGSHTISQVNVHSIVSKVRHRTTDSNSFTHNPLQWCMLIYKIAGRSATTTCDEYIPKVRLSISVLYPPRIRDKLSILIQRPFEDVISESKHV